MSEKKYAIVYFTHESQVEVVPSCWLVEKSSVRWPHNCTLRSIAKQIRECKMPQEEWNIIAIRILGFAKSFSAANRKATIALDTSNAGSDSSSSENETISRKRARPIRFCSSNEESEMPKERNNKKKMLYVPQTPTLIDDTSLYSTGNHCSSKSISGKSQESISASFISDKTMSDIRSFDDKAVCVMLSKVYKCLENIQKELAHVKGEQNKILYQLAELNGKQMPPGTMFTLPSGITIPVSTDEDLLKLNSQLKEDKNLTAALARYLYEVSLGKTPSALILSITKRILTRDVALQYSRLGRKGKKRFEIVSEIFEAILAAAALKFPDAAREELAEKFGRVLATAGDWDGSRVRKSVEPNKDV